MAKILSFVFVRAMSEAKGIRPPVSVFGIEGRYVAALYSAGHQVNQLEEVEKHFKNLQKELQNRNMIDFIETSFISRAGKAKVLEEVGKQVGMPSTGINFLACVAENGRLKMLRKMINIFLTIMVAHRKEAQCEVITAAPLDESSRNALMSALKKFIKDGKTITLKETVDPSIMGGMIVGVEDKHIDMSISRKIQKYTDILKQSI